MQRLSKINKGFYRAIKSHNSIILKRAANTTLIKGWVPLRSIQGGQECSLSSNGPNTRPPPPLDRQITWPKHLISNIYWWFFPDWLSHGRVLIKRMIETREDFFFLWTVSHCAWSGRIIYFWTEVMSFLLSSQAYWGWIFAGLPTCAIFFFK